MARRSRFTVYFDGEDTPTVILAYSAANARSHYERQGRVVARIHSGDYRKDAKARAIRRGGFRLDLEAVEDAKELLGLRLPVEIRFNSRVGDTNGCHTFRRTKTHDIMLKSYLTPEEASSTLWHELCHAMQAERAGGTPALWSAACAREGGFTYLNRPREVEARQMSDDMADLPLTLPA